MALDETKFIQPDGAPFVDPSDPNPPTRQRQRFQSTAYGPADITTILADIADLETRTLANDSKVTNATHTGDVTGSEVLTIAAGAVDIANLSAGGSPSASTFLRGDNIWAAPAGGGDLLAANNLSDVASAVTSLLNLGGIGPATVDVLSNKTFSDSVDATKTLALDLSGAATATATTLVTSQTVDRSITLPDASGTLTLQERYANALSTGVVSLDSFSINADPTKFDIGDAVLLFVDSTTDPENPTVTEVQFSATLAITDAHLATANITYVGINASGTVLQQATPYTDAQRRTIAVIGRSGHPDQVTITTAFTFPNLTLSPASQTQDLMEAIGLFNRSGNVYYR